MLLLSIHPKYVESILAGEKHVELRRLRPRINGGQALIYATSPRMELVATFRVASVIRSPLDLLWQSVREDACVTRGEFDSYFYGLETGVSIRIADVVTFRRSVPLDHLRAAWKGFHPPQGFRYLEWPDVAKLRIAELRRAA